LKAKRGSEQFQATNSRRARSYVPAIDSWLADPPLEAVQW
jgi:hypothetical protein